MQVYHISPRFLNTHFPDFPGGLTFEQKLEIFADREHGWRFEVASEMVKRDPRAGFAALATVTSYFEMIAKYQDGYCQTDRVEEYFRRGWSDVFSEYSIVSQAQALSNDEVQSHLDATARWLYKELRCELYHVGATGRGIRLIGDLDKAVAVDIAPDQSKQITINPELFVSHLVVHFGRYLARLRDPQEQTLRQNFEKRFDDRMKVK